MAESDGDIEYLDEDADIVQQCVHSNTQTQPVPVPTRTVSPIEMLPLLVERTPAERRKKRKKDEDDSDYDPSDDILPPSPPSPKGKKKKTPVIKKIKTEPKEILPVPMLSLKSTGVKKSSVLPAKFAAKERVLDRKKCEIKIPDYEDPLCLPVKAIQYENTDVKRLNNWNNVCLEHFKNCDNLLKPEHGDTHSSSRTVVFRNVVNKHTAKKETTIWSKTCVENNDGDRKSEIFQCVLPRYKEKRVLNKFHFGSYRPRPYHISDEVILCKEDNKDEDVLIVYKPKECTSSVYKLVTVNDSKNPDAKDEGDEDDGKMYMNEVVHCKMCAPCFQSSWRGVKRTQRRNVECPICGRSSVTVYNLLTHFKTHSTEEMKTYKKVISAILAEIVQYHYKCRVCREQFNSIKHLRQHVATHQGTEIFKCEVGNHLAK